MNTGNTFITLFVGVALLALIHFYGKEEPNPILEKKINMTRADQIKRKGYEIETLPDRICGYYYWKDDLKWNTDFYCVGQYGTVKVLPDSLTFFHRRMIDEVDKIAERKGFGGW